MDFQRAVRTVLREKYATFQGRAARSEYWWFMLFHFGVMVIGGLIVGLIGMPDRRGGDMSLPAMILFGLMVIYLLFAIIPTIAVHVRRFHDLDMSGWFYLLFMLLALIPWLGFLAAIGLLVMMARPGQPGENRFGPPPG